MAYQNYLLLNSPNVRFSHKGCCIVWNKKAISWISGRENWRKNLADSLNRNSKPVIWIHASSTGEFEQGRPVIEMLRKIKKNHFFLLTFFSPSGYQVHCNYSKVDSVQYLPLDSKSNANDFMEIVNPVVAIFVKYEFWYHFFNSISNAEIPLFLVSAKLTENHLFFKWYGAAYSKVLRLPTLFFVQDRSTEKLLQKLNVDNVMVTGDTRIDRVIEVQLNDRRNEILEQFLGGQKAVIVGSSWEAEEDIIIKWLNSGAYTGKVILAPHEINEQRIQELSSLINCPTIQYTSIELGGQIPEGQVLILDCIGILKELYRYGNWALIGGGFEDGIHNILEPSVFGLPTIFGPNYKKFSEAVDLIELGGAASVNSYKEFFEESTKLMNPDEISARSEICKKYIHQNRGASQKVTEHIVQYL